MTSLKKIKERVYSNILSERGTFSEYRLQNCIHREYAREMSRLDDHEIDTLHLMENWEYLLRRERKRIQRRSNRNPATAGHLSERFWIKVLKEFLPPQFAVVQTAHLSFPDISQSPQIDIAILKPGTSPAMVESGFYHTESIIAGFECKLTLTRDSIRKTIENCGKLKRAFPAGSGTGANELKPPFLYGLLAMGHHIRNKEKEAADSVKDALASYSASLLHPREMLDLLVVPGQFCFSAAREPNLFDATRIDGGYDQVICEIPYSHPSQNALGAFFARLLEYLRVDRPDLDHISKPFSFFGYPSITSFDARLRWPVAEVLTPASARELIRESDIQAALDWD